MGKLIKEIFVYFVKFILSLYFFVIWYASKEIVRSKEFFLCRIFLCLPRVVADFLRTMIDFAQIKSVSGGFFCNLLPMDNRLTALRAPSCLLCHVSRTRIPGDAVGTVVDDPSGNAVLLHFLLYFLMQQKTPRLHELAIRQFEDAIISKRG